MIGRKFINFLPKSIRKQSKEIYENLMRGIIEPFEYSENPILTKSGEERQIAWHNTVLKDQNNRIVGTLSSGEDITERKLAEKALSERIEQYQRLEVNIPGMVYTYAEHPDGSHSFPYANQGSRLLFDIKPEDLMRDGSLLSDLIYPDDKDRRDESIRVSLETLQPWRQELRHIVNGQVRWYDCMSRPQPQPNGDVLWDGIILEITDRKDAERKLQQYQEQLKSLALELSLAEERERRRIAAGIHDDIAQRLALAKFELKSMQNTISDTDVLTSLESQCETMDRIMHDARSLTFELSNPLLYEIGVEAAVESFLMEQIQKKSGIKCIFTSQGPQINLNEEIRVVLYQGVRELLTNVVKYAHASHVEVRMTKSNNQISIIIQDNGIGFNVSKLSLPDRDRGGFGLFNIRERLEYLNGNLNIQSTPNKGTCVTMSIPLKSQATAQEKESMP